MKTTFEISQGTYVHTINVTVNSNVHHTTGAIVGKLAHRFYTVLATMRLVGNGAGIDLRKPFEIVIKTEGVTLLNTFEIDEQIKGRITCGLTKRGQNRFARLLAIAFWDGKHELTDEVYCDLLDENNTCETEQVMAQVRALLDTPYSEVVTFVAENE